MEHRAWGKKAKAKGRTRIQETPVKFASLWDFTGQAGDKRQNDEDRGRSFRSQNSGASEVRGQSLSRLR
jgi:hypothetical protein